MREDDVRERAVGGELKVLIHLLRRYVDQLLHGCEVGSVSSTNIRVMRYIKMHPGEDIFPRDLEQHLSVTRATSSKVLKLMEEKGMIRRLSVPHDARLKKIEMTEQGDKIYQKIIEDFQCAEQTLIRGFSEEELETLRGYLKRMQRNLESSGGEDACASFAGGEENPE